MTGTAPITRRSSESGAVLGIDVGGSGSRAAIRGAGQGARQEITGPPTTVGARGSSVPELVRDLILQATSAWPDQMAGVDGVGIGATGLASLVESPSELVTDVADALDAPVAVAIDAVTAHLGALDGEGGAVIALGTGAIAISHPGAGTSQQYPADWRRVDGWGHLLGDRGGGAWLGRRALERALRAHDGVDTAGAALLESGRDRFGEPRDWPAQMYTRADRAGVLASFASDIASLALDGDPAAADLLTEAGEEAALSVLAALGSDHPARVVLTGGLVRARGALEERFRRRVSAHPRRVHVHLPMGDPLDGALRLGRMASAGQVTPQEGFVWR